MDFNLLTLRTKHKINLCPKMPFIPHLLQTSCNTELIFPNHDETTKGKISDIRSNFFSWRLELLQHSVCQGLQKV